MARPWTCHDVELALWAFHLAKKFDLELELAAPTPREAASEQGAEEEPKSKRMKL